MNCFEIDLKQFETNHYTVMTQAIEVASSLHSQDFENSEVLGCWDFVLLKPFLLLLKC